MSAGAAVVQVSDVHKAFGPNVVLRGIDLEVRAGETMVILGGSGSGKSTLLRCILGLTPPDSGWVSVYGSDPYAGADQSEVRQRIGMAFQGGALFGSMTLAENLDLPLEEFTGLPRSTRRIIIGIKLALVGLEGAIDRYPSELSGGMRKRAAVARALALDPELLMFDEPSAGLDPITAAGLDRLLLQLKEVFGITLVIVTHEMESAFAVADRMAVMHRGRFIVTGTPDEVRACTDPMVRRFLDRQPEEDDDDGERYRRLMLGPEVADE